MKTIGLIGGMSWQSTRTYYDLLNEMVAARLGGLHSAEILMRSVDFAGLEAAMQRGDWTAIESRLGDEAAALEQGGAGCVLLCSNTMHKLYGSIATRVGIDESRATECTDATASRQRLRHEDLSHSLTPLQQVFVLSILLCQSRPARTHCSASLSTSATGRPCQCVPRPPRAAPYGVSPAMRTSSRVPTRDEAAS